MGKANELEFKPTKTGHSREKKVYRCKEINGVCWKRDYVFISRLNIFITILAFIAGALMVAYASIDLEYMAIIMPFGVALLFFSFVSLAFSRYAFLNSRFGIWKKNEYVNQAIRASSLKYFRGLKLKYFSIVFYQLAIFIPFFYGIIGLIIAATSGQADWMSDMNWVSFGIGLAFYLSWFFLIFLDYINSYDENKIENKRLSFIRRFNGYWLYAFYWCFMIKPEDYIVDENHNKTVVEKEELKAEREKARAKKTTPKKKSVKN